MRSYLCTSHFLAERGVEQRRIAFNVIVRTSIEYEEGTLTQRNFEDALWMVADGYAYNAVTEKLGDDWWVDEFDDIIIEEICKKGRFKNVPVIIAEDDETFFLNWHDDSIDNPFLERN